MSGVEFSARQGAPLPSITSLNVEKRDITDYEHRPSTAAAASLSYASFQAPSPSSAHPPISAPPVPASLSGLISPPESRRTSGDEKEQRQPQPTRQSLPSIHEALGQEQGYLQPTSHPAGPASTSQSPYHQASQQLPPREPIQQIFAADSQSQISRATFPQTTTAPSPGIAPLGAAPPLPFQSGPSDSLRRGSYPSPQNSKLPTLHPLRTEPATIPSSLPSTPYQAYPSQSSPSYEPASHPQSAGPTSNPFPYSNPPQSSYPYSASALAPPGTAYPASASFSAANRPPRFANAWRPDAAELSRVEETKRNGRLVGPAYGESVKRHLDNFDLEASLNEIAEVSGRMLDFARHYGQRAHQTQRTGPLSGSMPSSPEVDEQLKQQQRLHDALVQLREVVQTQQIAEQVKDPRYKTINGYDTEESTAYNNDPGKGGFAGPDPKKRRGRAAPPGRCHSCNRAETPEWRRGPDGARTLCNACGLHYAKLTRKMGNNKASIGSSNLRPKSMGPGSPAT